MSVPGLENRSEPRSGRSDAGEAKTEHLDRKAPSREGLPPAALADLLVAEQRSSWLRGERLSVEEYLHRHPALQEAPEAFPLITAAPWRSGWPARRSCRARRPGSRKPWPGPSTTPTSRGSCTAT
jgi:hypothetical protein